MGNKKTLRQRALDLLARREYSRCELMQRLMHTKVDLATLSALLDELAGQGWQSDQRFAEEYVHAHRHKKGKLYLFQALKQHGISNEILHQIDFGNEYCYAKVLWKKKFGFLASTAGDKAKQVRFLTTHGFSASIALKIVNQKTLQDKEVFFDESEES